MVTTSGHYGCDIVMSYTEINKAVPQWLLTFILCISATWPLTFAFHIPCTRTPEIIDMHRGVCDDTSVTKFNRTITHHPFKLGLPNLRHRCKIPWLRSLLFVEWLTLTFKVKFNLKGPNLPHFEFIHIMTQSTLKLESPNLDQRYKIPLLRPLLFWGVINLDLQDQI